MKFNWKNIFRDKNNYSSKEEINEAYHDKAADFYFTNLINSLILFSLSASELEKLRGPAFDPIFELESEIDYAYTPVCFEAVFRNKLINTSHKQDLKEFKKRTDNIPSEIWDMDIIDSHDTWISIRKEANELLNKIGVQHREYNDDYTTILDEYGRVIKQGK